MSSFPPMCEGIVEDDISGVGPRDHRWVEGPEYPAPAPDTGQPARWQDLVCEVCGVVTSGWKREERP